MVEINLLDFQKQENGPLRDDFHKRLWAAYENGKATYGQIAQSLGVIGASYCGNLFRYGNGKWAHPSPDVVLALANWLRRVEAGEDWLQDLERVEADAEEPRETIEEREPHRREVVQFADGGITLSAAVIDELRRAGVTTLTIDLREVRARHP